MFVLRTSTSAGQLLADRSSTETLYCLNGEPFHSLKCILQGLSSSEHQFVRTIISSLRFHSVSTVKPIGCFKDTGRRAIPGVDGRYPIVRGYYRRRKEAIQKCGAVALMRGYKAFAVQHQGWCATGPRAHLTYKRYGRSNRCRNGKGGPWANDVYVVSGKSIINVIGFIF